MADNDSLGVQRGNYNWTLPGPLLLFLGRLACIPLQYSIIAYHPLSILGFSRPPTGGSIVLPCLPAQWATQPLSPVVFLAMTTALVAKQGIWVLGIGNEYMSIPFATFGVLADFIYEGISALVFTGAAVNPFWRPSFLYVGAAIQMTAVLLELAAELHRKSFKSKAENKGKLYTDKHWGHCRHPNFALNVVYGAAFGFAAGGPIYAMLTGGMYLSNFTLNAIKPKEDYLAKKYGEQWEQYKKDVRWKLFPGIY
ncbi:uncharacterized protein K460DRAFT_278617 [Cucurbitaria berberidis CBS 394.84]|uniref:Delta(14)-sterol reductase n=1 Tax=Cucurbitaria berberidis CBS 394.84 TaxID=1168544 RepID=A0A9P4GM85_9PLEO|nr:uncharacterized protein K460DRAFT_278617 [Cucurbitaria berberidis CBS 394.84]KAF1847906.1 hypothetical protein K460DRAFT_278617 [Cucurbitaria berberidis CBS 394.84]